MKKIAVSYLGVKNIGSTLMELDKTDVDLIHVDVMDGKYVQNKTMSFNELKKIGYYTKKRLDVHLMVMKPLNYIDDYASLNVASISVHLDIRNNVAEVLERIKEYGIKAGIALNPGDDIDKIIPYLDKIDQILVMSVNPGLPGQTFIEDVLPKIDALRDLINKQNLKITLSVDGGVNLENCAKLSNVDIIVSGSCITKSDNYQDTITKLRYLGKVEKN